MRTKSSSSIRAALYLVLLLALLPAAGLLIYSGLAARQDAQNSAQIKSGLKLRLLGQQQTVFFENIRAFMLSLTRRDELSTADSETQRSEISRLLAESLTRYSACKNIYAADTQGRVFAAAVGYRGGVNIRESRIFSAALDNLESIDSITYGGMSEDPFTGQRALHCASPFFSPQGQPLGVIVLSFTEIVPLEYLQELALPQHSRLSAFDSDGSLIFSCYQGKMFETDAALGADEVYGAWSGLKAQTGSEGFYTSSGQNGAKILNAFLRVFPEAVADARSTRSIELYAEDNDVPGRYPSLTLHLLERADQAYAGAKATLYGNLLLLAEAVLAALAILQALAHAWLFKPVRQLLSAAGRISAGQFGSRVNTVGLSGDFVSLGNSLNGLAEALESGKQDLSRARNAALAASRIKSEFLSNMSHGIRTPMNAIMGMASLLLKSALNAKQKNYLGKIYSAANNLQDVINGILDYSKIESGRFSLEELPFSIDELMVNTMAVVYPKAEEKGLAVTFSIAPEVPSSLVGDSLRLGQILNNLCGNAIKFTARGVVEISCKLLERRGDQVRLSFIVRDTGIGMNNEQLGRIFQAFMQADGSTSRKFGGTGLGLPIAKRLAELMNGGINVFSQPGQGSSVEVTVWLQSAEEGGETAEALRAFLGYPVLLIDDNPESGNIFEAELRGLGLRVDRAATLEEGFRLLDAPQGEYKLVCLELFMRAMNGLDMARQIRKRLEQNKLPPLLAVSSVPCALEIRLRCEEVGVLGIIHKSMTRRRLAQLLENIFKNRPDKLLAAEPEAATEAVPVAVPFTNDTLPPLPGLNKAALTRLGGNTRLYKKLLTQFAEFYKDLGEQYRKAIDSAETGKAIRMAHTLKGLAASIGADELSAAALDLETALRGGSLAQAALAEKCFALLADLQSMLAEALHSDALHSDALHSDATASPDKGEAQVQDSDAAGQALDTLIEFLQDGDAEATTFFEYKRGSLEPLLSREQFDKLDRALLRFDFDEALTVLSNTQGDAQR